MKANIGSVNANKQEDSVRLLSFLLDNQKEYQVAGAFDSKCDFSGALPEQLLAKIEKSNGGPIKRHMLSSSVSVIVASGEEADACTEYVELDTLIRFKHGPVRRNKMKFALLKAQDWGVYVGIPILHHLGVLPTQVLDRYIRKETDVPGRDIPLFFQRKASVSKLKVKDPLMTMSIEEMYVGSKPNDSIEAPEMRLPPGESDQVAEGGIPEFLEDEPEPVYLEKKMRRYRLLLERDQRFKFSDKRYQKRKDLLEYFAKACYDFENVISRYEKTLRKRYGSKNETVKSKMRALPSLSEFIPLLVEYTDVWRSHFGDDGFATVTPCPLKWDPAKNNGNGPIKGAVKSRNLSEPEENWLKEHLDVLQNIGVTERVLPSDDWVKQNGMPKACVIFVVPKKGVPPDDKRMIEDFRNTNDYVMKMFYPLLDIKQAHKSLALSTFKHPFYLN